MTTWKVGAEIEILGPLGNTFEIDPKIKTHILVGGGVGLAPMVFMSEVLSQKKLNFAFFSGGRNDKEYFPDLNNSEKMFISTDDGSQGFHGNIIQLLEKEIGNFARPAVIYACGPEKMSEAVKYFGKKHNLETQISMETLMACGMGLCQGCAIKTYDDAGHDSISLVCKDGPVFRGDKINFD
jgi:dihydroorotate dehydrogenase electron transfer subunit